MAVYFAGFLAASVVLIARSPWFSFFCWIGFVQAFQYLTGAWRYVGVIGTAVLVSIGQTGGFRALSAPTIVVYVAITLLNAAVVISFPRAELLRAVQAAARGEAACPRQWRPGCLGHRGPAVHQRGDGQDPPAAYLGQARGERQGRRGGGRLRAGPAATLGRLSSPRRGPDNGSGTRPVDAEARWRDTLEYLSHPLRSRA
jgi:hypothetical protein